MVADSPVILLVKEPIPVPLDVFVESEIVGLLVVPQTTPLAVMGLSPAAVIFPPLVAAEVVIDVADTVADIVAKDPAEVVKLISVP